ncbi:MAG: transposase family protein [Candidatus Hydrothermarchaeales archaeon]
MKLELRMEYLETIYRRYRQSPKESKGKILDELCKVCKYKRKYAIWKLSQLPVEEKSKSHPKRKRERKYGHEVMVIVEKVWRKANYPWSLRLKEILRLWLPWIRVRYRTSPEVDEKLLSISASTIDRNLRDKKRKLKRRLYGRTKPGTLLRHKIPVKTDCWDVKSPGFMEADLLSHSGGSSRGEFIHSLNLTDIFSSWVETEAVMGKGERGITDALERIFPRLPFKIRGLDSDNGSEFINHHLFRYCEERRIQFTRSRPYKKDDNAHIEQKNWTHVRKFMGWDRYDSSQALEAMNDLYENELPLFMNLFQPSVRLQKIIRKGSRKHRIYDKPQTPMDRLLTSGQLDEKRCEELEVLRERLDPFNLSEVIEQKLERIWDLAHYRFKPDEKKRVDEKEDELSPVEREVLEGISQSFGINVYVRTRKNGELIAVNHG